MKTLIAEYPQSTTTPLAVDFNGKNITNAGIGTFNGVRIPAGDLIMTGSNEAIYTNATDSDGTTARAVVQFNTGAIKVIATEGH